MLINPDAPIDARLASLTHAYLDADYRWELDGHWHDLCIGLPAPGLEKLSPQASCFGFLSAWNPSSVERDDAENRSADAALHAILLETGAPCRPAFASAPNRTWREPSWVVMGMERPEFDVLVRQFAQLGSFWWRAGEPVRLRMDARCPPGFADGGFVDWLHA